MTAGDVAGGTTGSAGVNVGLVGSAGAAGGGLVAGVAL